MQVGRNGIPGRGKSPGNRLDEKAELAPSSSRVSKWPGAGPERGGWRPMARLEVQLERLGP